MARFVKIFASVVLTAPSPQLSASSTKSPYPMLFSRRILPALALAIVLPLATQACKLDPDLVDPITPTSRVLPLATQAVALMPPQTVDPIADSGASRPSIPG